MVYSNLTVMLTVIAVVLCVLAITAGAVYCLNRAVDQGDSR
jgi:hypothetical protein